MAQNIQDFISSTLDSINNMLNKLSTKEKISYGLIALGIIFIIIGVIML